MLHCRINTIKKYFFLCEKSNDLIIKRCGHTLRGKPPGIAKTLDQRLTAIPENNCAKREKINIGFCQVKFSRSQLLKERISHLKEQRNSNSSSKFNLTEVKKEWLETSGPFQLQKIAEHYGIYEHLFGDGYFVPRVNIQINFNSSNDTLSPVYNGNILIPSDAKNEPEINYDYKFDIHGNDVKNSLWTLILTNPDGHLTEQNKEYVHWFIGNIPNNEISNGEKIVPYLQPFPAKGTGYHRNIFILYKQEKKLDFTKFKVNKVNDLTSRTFETLKFYEEFQDYLTPAGLGFFQTTWEKELTNFYHNTLGIKEPIYEYDFPKAYIKDQKWFPLKEPFNLYMDKYRDQKQVAKEYLERKLAKTHPFNGPETPLKYPNAHPIKNLPSWLRTEIKKDRLKWGRINDF